MRIRRGIIWAAIAVAAIIAIVVTAPRLLRRVSFFRVRQIEVIGARYLDESEVARSLALRPEASTFDDLAPVRAAAAAIPGVVRASVERVLPGTLRITLDEAVPVAIAPLSDRVALLDANGHLLPFDPTRVPASLPIASQDSLVARLLGRLMQADPPLFGMIESAHVERGDVLLEVGTRRIRLRPEADDAVLRAITAVLGYLNGKSIAWREIDARYRDRVFVQKGAA